MSTNGRTPGEAAETAAETATDAAEDARAALDNDEAPTPDYTVAVSPRQLAGGFVVLAALLVWLFRRRRKGA